MTSVHPKPRTRDAQASRPTWIPEMKTNERTRPHPIEGWDEQRHHEDGTSYWRRGERHRASGWAVDRAGLRQAWLFGHRIATPDHAPTDPLTFGGQSPTGRITWHDRGGRERVTCWQTDEGIEETRLLGVDGEPERHWRNGHQAVRVLRTGERRHYEFDGRGWRLHRVGAPAIEHPDATGPALWFEHGSEVEAPVRLLDDAKRLAIARWEAGLDAVPFPLEPAEFARVAAFVVTSPDDEVSWELSVAFPDAWLMGMRSGRLIPV